MLFGSLVFSYLTVFFLYRRQFILSEYNSYLIIKTTKKWNEEIYRDSSLAAFSMEYSEK